MCKFLEVPVTKEPMPEIELKTENTFFNNDVNKFTEIFTAIGLLQGKAQLVYTIGLVVSNQHQNESDWEFSSFIQGGKNSTIGFVTMFVSIIFVGGEVILFGV